MHRSVPALLIAVVLAVAPASAAEPFVQESCPSPGADSRLADLAISPSGRVVVSVGLNDSGDLRDRTLVLRATLGPAVFSDGFDGGDASLWSATVP